MPGDTKPHKARAAKKRRRVSKIGGLEDARAKLWQAITTAEDLLLEETADPSMTLRAVHAITQACAAYVKLVESSELEARVAELEAQVASRNSRAVYN
jgi:hypothetical protein